jgi:hypothetical protein
MAWVPRDLEADSAAHRAEGVFAVDFRGGAFEEFFRGFSGEGFTL